MTRKNHCLIITAGPSLAVHRALVNLVLEWTDCTVIAVNRAAKLFPHCAANWCVAGDIGMASELAAADVFPLEGVCTMAATADLIPQGHCPRWTSDVPGRDGRGQSEHPIITWESLPGFRSTWCRPGIAEGFSITAALALAQHLGHRETLLVGHDARPGPDCAGGDGDNRSPDRWQREASELRSFIAGSGLTIHTIQPFTP
jgi:hypothetical protein